MLNRVVTAILIALLGVFVTAGGVAAQSTRVDALLRELADPENAAWRRTERELVTEWSKSGSAAMDLLLQRGREAMRNGDHAAAIEHLTALTDHAPDFAEGWNARATAYFHAGQYGPSIDDIAMTLTLNPSHFGALAGLGAIFSELGDKQKALAAYRAALAIHPHLERIKAAADRLERELRGQEL
ncbi:MAG: tetratricopeptide repeat protein [Gemmobacter sp.]